MRSAFEPDVTMVRKNKVAPEGTVWLSPLWWWLSCLTAVLAAGAGAAGLAVSGRVYGRETVVLSDAATAQDIVTLVVVAPLLALLATWARRGSLRAFLGLLGCLAFTVYNYVIYAFSIHFGPLFLVWVAVLGLSVFALVGALVTADMAVIKRRFAGKAMPGTAWLLIVVAALFVLLWLSEVVPDLLAGAPSRSAGDWNLPTNPVHVLDLALFSPILVTPLVANAREHDPGWGVMMPIAMLLVATLAVLVGLLRRTAASPGVREDQAG